MTIVNLGPLFLSHRLDAAYEEEEHKEREAHAAKIEQAREGSALHAADQQRLQTEESERTSKAKENADAGNELAQQAEREKQQQALVESQAVQQEESLNTSRREELLEQVLQETKQEYEEKQKVWYRPVSLYS